MLTNICGFIGRVLLGLYFLIPGIAKFMSWDAHVDLMISHHMLFVSPLLFVASVLEIALGGFLIFNQKIMYSALILAGLVLLINYNLHDFWNYAGIEQAHEMQNFIKNLAIFAGLLVLSTTSKPN